jgi:hypothetical protein
MVCGIQQSLYLVRSLRIADDTHVLLGDEGHSDSHFFVIFPDDCMQERKKFLFLLRVVLRSVYVAANPPHEFHIVHTNAIPSPARAYTILLWPAVIRKYRNLRI